MALVGPSTRLAPTEDVKVPWGHQRVKGTRMTTSEPRVRVHCGGPCSRGARKGGNTLGDLRRARDGSIEFAEDKIFQDTDDQTRYSREHIRGGRRVGDGALIRMCSCGCIYAFPAGALAHQFEALLHTGEAIAGVDVGEFVEIAPSRVMSQPG